MKVLGSKDTIQNFTKNILVIYIERKIYRLYYMESLWNNYNSVKLSKGLNKL